MKQGWTQEKVNDAITRIGTPYFKPDGDQIIFYKTNDFLDDNGAFWFDASIRFLDDNCPELIELKYRIVVVVFQYDHIEFACTREHKGRIYCAITDDDAVYQFGDCLNELYQAIESGVGDESRSCIQ